MLQIYCGRKTGSRYIGNMRLIEMNRIKYYSENKDDDLTAVGICNIEYRTNAYKSTVQVDL